MVDALLNAAHSEDSEYMEDERDDVPQIPQAHVRTCEFCGSSNTPTWRRGPGGKGSLCNACGIKWRLRKRTKKGEQSVASPERKPKSAKASPATRKRKFKEEEVEEPPILPTRGAESLSPESKGLEFSEDSPENADNRKNYYCKYCNKTWDITYFKNSQQFGAHCSNCSRKPKQDEAGPQSMYYADSAPTNLILILRYLQDELSDLEDEDSIPPPSPSSPAPPVGSSPPAQVPSFPHTRQLPPLPSLALPRPSYDPLNTLRLAANECWPTTAVG